MPTNRITAGSLRPFKLAHFAATRSRGLLAGFLRARLGTSLAVQNAPTLEDLLGTDRPDETTRGTMLDDLDHWLASEAGGLALVEAERLRDSLGPYRSIGFASTELAGELRRRIVGFLAEHLGRLKSYQDERARLRAEEKDHAAGALGHRIERYLGQRLLDLFVRAGLVPTYAFPVDNVRLEVMTRPGAVRSKAFLAAGDDLDLVRDASLAISEYAPGAEIVAGGRVWASAGIARYSGELENERFYKLCARCNHPEIRDFQDQIPVACTNCGAALEGPSGHRQIANR